MSIAFTAYAKTADNYDIQSSSATYATAAGVGGTLTAAATTNLNAFAGQRLATGTYDCFQTYFHFDTSGFPSSGATVALNFTPSAPTNTPVLEAYNKTYTATDTTNWVAASSLSSPLGSATCVASGTTTLALSSWSVSSSYGIMLAGQDQRLGNAPVDTTDYAGLASANSTTGKPYLSATISGTNTVKSLTAGTYTITVGGGGGNDPPSGTTAIQFECWGAGGGGGGGKGGGGGGGGYALKTVTCVNGDVFTVTVPSGGAAGTSSGSGGGTGTDTESKVVRSGTTLCRATGGSGGITAGIGGNAGGATTSDIGFSGGGGGAGGGGGTQGGGSGGGGAGSAGTGGNGAAGSTATSTTRPAAGAAGTPDGGAGGQGGAKVSVAGTGSAGGTGLVGAIPGGGGGGGSSSQAGGAGADGQAKVTWVTPPAVFFNRQARLAYMEL